MKPTNYIVLLLGLVNSLHFWMLLIGTLATAINRINRLFQTLSKYCPLRCIESIGQCTAFGTAFQNVINCMFSC